jgi:hypothetical protein
MESSVKTVLDFAGHVVSVTTTLLSVKGVHRLYKAMNAYVPIKLYLQNL